MFRLVNLCPVFLVLALLAVAPAWGLTPYPPTVPPGVTPQWTPVPGNPEVEYALNLKVDLFRCGGRYYYWVAGGWKESASPTGPWKPASMVPPALQKLPPGLFKSIYKPPAPRR